MPQLWLTYRELGQVFGVGEEVARAESSRGSWPRRRCADGQTRVELPDAAAHQLILAYAAKHVLLQATARDENTRGDLYEACLERSLASLKTLLRPAPPRSAA